MGTSVCSFVRQRKASNSSQVNSLKEMELAEEITLNVVPQSPT